MLSVGKLLAHVLEHLENGLISLANPVLAVAVQALLVGSKVGQPFLDFFSLSHFSSETAQLTALQAQHPLASLI
jgi:hypothetical protein